MKKLLKGLLSCAMVFSLVGCSSSESASSGSVLPVSIASEPASLDPALNSSVDGATMIVHLFSGLAKWSQNSNGVLEIVADVAEELVDPVENADGTVTYTYTIRSDAKWSDGEPVKASDFEFAWQRANDQTYDYCYMFEVVSGYDDTQDDGGTLAVVADDTTNTLSVTCPVAVSYWNELLAFPAFMPVREDVVDDEGAWATDPATYVCNGPYVISSWTHDSVIKLTKNENYYDADSITMPEIDFYLSDDASTMLSNFKNGDWLMIDDVPTDEMESLAKDYPTEYVVEGQIGTYYVIFNMNEDLSPAGKTLTAEEQAEVRSALALLLDRNYIVDDVVQGGQVPASSFVAMGMTDADGSQFYENAGHNDGYVGYYNVDSAAFEANCAEAVEILSKYYTWDGAKFTDFPTMTYLYNTSSGHKAIAEYIQSAFATYGITLNLENQEWATFLETRKNGDYSIARNGWLADYNDPICFLDMWTTASGNNDAQYGKGDHEAVAIYNLDLSGVSGYESYSVTNGTWSQTYDVLIKLIKTCKDTATRMQLMHVAEDLLMSTGAICPLYFYTDIYMISDKVSGFYSNPLGYKYFMYTTISE